MLSRLKMATRPSQAARPLPPRPAPHQPPPLILPSLPASRLPRAPRIDQAPTNLPSTALLSRLEALSSLCADWPPA
ncbi:hypothetical protein E2C01_012390 [Portunus trituberculatus]|uniref:Uncharacterized protein n=1 Tax=Portunus trituberculatus TaxID=210409 RepID=A0A5B7DEI7_PORTR|nr:hypothetical protein [Portunus trituberculatus]